MARLAKTPKTRGHRMPPPQVFLSECCQAAVRAAVRAARPKPGPTAPGPGYASGPEPRRPPPPHSSRAGDRCGCRRTTRTAVRPPPHDTNSGKTVARLAKTPETRGHRMPQPQVFLSECCQAAVRAAVRAARPKPGPTAPGPGYASGPEPRRPPPPHSSRAGDRCGCRRTTRTAVRPPPHDTNSGKTVARLAKTPETRGHRMPQPQVFLSECCQAAACARAN